MATLSAPRRPELLGAEEMRAILGIGRSGFYELARRDALPVPTIRVGKRLMFSRRAVDEMLNRTRASEPADSQPDQDAA